MTHSNKYAAANKCVHCEGIIRHTDWCITTNQNVFYAFAATLDPMTLTKSDHLYLRSLGVLWN